MTDIVVIGIGGLGREIHELVEDIAEQDGSLNMIGFLDGKSATHGTKVHGYPVLGDVDWLAEHPEVAATIGIGSPATKSRIARRLTEYGTPLPTLIHPRSTLGRFVELGEGGIVTAGTVITTDVRIGHFCTFNLNVTIGHDCVIDDFANFAPGAHISGNVHIGEGTDIGTGASVIQGIEIGEWSILGANASAVKPIPANVTAVGVPAKVIKEREPGWQTA